MSPLDSKGPSRTDPQTRRALESLRADLTRERASDAATIAALRTELASLRALVMTHSSAIAALEASTG